MGASFFVNGSKKNLYMKVESANFICISSQHIPNSYELCIVMIVVLSSAKKIAFGQKQFLCIVVVERDMPTSKISMKTK
jgi:hypothetical protein